ncbi:MAG: hypothetical protein CMG78_09415 [Marinobacter sp.]|nr:hypothetical protein [Marinobacter sp.]
MSKTAHTPGPIAVDKYGTIMARDRFGGVELFPISGVVLSDGEKARANRARFIALWNACEGIANPDVVPEAIEALRGVRWRSADRDNMEFVATITYSQMDKLRAILAKLEGRS